MKNLGEIEAEFKEQIITFQTTIYFIKSADFSMQSFYYKDNKYEKVEQELLKHDEKKLDDYYEKYMK